MRSGARAAFAAIAVLVGAGACTDLGGLAAGGGGVDGSVDSSPPDATSPIDGGADAALDVSPPDGATIDGGADAEAGNGCPGTAGPSPVRVGGGTQAFCIDGTEVTNAQYMQFLTATKGTVTPPAGCAWKTSYQPGIWPYPSGKDANPVAFVDSCDAAAFCTWAGKRLCGKIGGGATPSGGYLDPTKSQWFFACTNAGDGLHAFPYGNTFVARVCNNLENDAGGSLPVGTEKQCVGGFPGIYDMSGNVWELEDMCLPADAGAAHDQCLIRSGAWTSDDTVMSCSAAFTVERQYTANDVGFRCCSL